MDGLYEDNIWGCQNKGAWKRQCADLKWLGKDEI